MKIISLFLALLLFTTAYANIQPVQTTEKLTLAKQSVISVRKLIITEKTEIKLDNQPCRIEDIVPEVTIELLELQGDEVIRVHFKRLPPPH